MSTILPAKSIVVEGRVRRDLGSLRTLERSIEELGMLSPILVVPNADGEYRLLAGERRLRAARNLSWEEVPAIVVTTLTSAADLLAAERDENTERKPFTPTELAEMAKRLRAVEEPAAKERQGRPGQPRSANVGGTKGETRDRVAEALGVGRENLRKIEDVIDTATDETQPEEVRAVAAEAAAEMDATGNVEAAHKKVRKAKAAAVEPAQPPAEVARLGYLARMSTEFSKTHDGLFLLEGERMAEVSDLERTETVYAFLTQLREWADGVEVAYRRAKLRVAQ